MVNRGYSTSRGREFKSQCQVLDGIFINDVFGGSPGLVVNKVDSTSRGREFKSQCLVLDGILKMMHLAGA